MHLLLALLALPLVEAEPNGQSLNDQCVSGPVKGTHCMIECGVDYPGGDYAQRKTSSLSACVVLCNNDSQCTDAQYHQENGYCYLKNRLTSAQKQSNVDTIICNQQPTTSMSKMITVTTKKMPTTTSRTTAAISNKSTTKSTTGISTMKMSTTMIATTAISTAPASSTVTTTTVMSSSTTTLITSFPTCNAFAGPIAVQVTDTSNGNILYFVDGASETDRPVLALPSGASTFAYTPGGDSITPADNPTLMFVERTADPHQLYFDDEFTALWEGSAFVFVQTDEHDCSLSFRVGQYDFFLLQYLPETGQTSLTAGPVIAPFVQLSARAVSLVS